MPFSPGEEEGTRNRRWIFAEYETDPLGARKKVPGTGVEVDRKAGYEIPCRGFNRPDQRYELPPDEMRARRSTRAIAEEPESLALRMDGGNVEVVSASENRYDVNGPDQPSNCACPDFFRLQVSYPDEDIVCKHILIARLKEAAIHPDPLPVGVLWIAERLGVHYKTVQDACRKGTLPASKVKRTWVITEADALTFIALYQSKMHDPNFYEWYAANIGTFFAIHPPVA